MVSNNLQQKPTAIITGDIYKEHDTGRHPENAGRLTAILEVVNELLAEDTGRFVNLAPEEISLEVLKRVGKRMGILT